MKNLIVQFLLATILSFTSFADLVVPETVDDAFRQKYPNAPEPTWEVDTNGSYEANYKINGVKYRADFTKEGIWSETENNIDFNELPPDVRSAYLLKYSSEDFRDAEAVDSATQGIFYEIEIVSGTSKIDVMFDNKGQIITPGVPTSENGFFQFWMDQAAQDSPLIRQGWSLVYKVV
ncbi:PepSY-like domain-containing protein, partial [Akkermansiaceae bacterium]|nr:PepSY-like domain-containing protein [Akkermansiaceae bacterium]